MSKPRDEFTHFVLDQLARVPALTSTPFFGGIGLRSGASFFGVIMGGSLYFSTSPATRAEYEKRGSKCFSYAKQGKMPTARLPMRAENTGRWRQVHFLDGLIRCRANLAPTISFGILLISCTVSDSLLRNARVALSPG
jgi:TfoX/Sxy family transcriptional regulator of competence genes